MKWNLEIEPFHYNYMQILARNIILPSRQNQFFEKNIFNNAVIRKIAVAIDTISAVAGSFHENPFNYQQFDLRELKFIRGEGAIV